MCAEKDMPAPEVYVHMPNWGDGYSIADAKHSSNEDRGIKRRQER